MFGECAEPHSKCSATQTGSKGDVRSAADLHQDGIKLGQSRRAKIIFADWMKKQKGKIE